MTDSTDAEDSSDFKVQFGNGLRRAQRVAGMTSIELARTIGVGPPYISRTMNGLNNLSMSRMVELAKAVGCKLTVVFSPITQPSNIDADAIDAMISSLDDELRSLAELRDRVCGWRENIVKDS